MCGMLNGFAYDCIFRPSGATFLVFADYARPSIRLAALAGLPVLYIFTHDSVGVGEDGPTHQPVETVSGLRVIPNLDVIRPADPEETAGAFVAACDADRRPDTSRAHAPESPNLNDIPVQSRREGVARAATWPWPRQPSWRPSSWRPAASCSTPLLPRRNSAPGTRVVSMPSFYRFDLQPAEYREEVLPSHCRRRVAIEAGVTGLWYKYVGLDGKVVGIDRFGLSAPGATVMEKLGITAENLVKVVESLPEPAVI